MARSLRSYLALISSVMSTKDRVPFYVNACHELGIEVLPPDVNTSQVDFAVVEGKIRFGLNAVKNVGESACHAIIVARQAGGIVRGRLDGAPRRPAADGPRDLDRPQHRPQRGKRQEQGRGLQDGGWVSRERRHGVHGHGHGRDPDPQQGD